MNLFLTSVCVNMLFCNDAVTACGVSVCMCLLCAGRLYLNCTYSSFLLKLSIPVG